MPWYKTGTVSVTNGSSVVTGVGTLFVGAVLRGEGLRLTNEGTMYEIEEVVNATTVLLSSPYIGITASNQPYSIIPVQDYLKLLAIRAAQLIEQVENDKIPPVVESRLSALESGEFSHAAGLGLSQENFTTDKSDKLDALPDNATLQLAFGSKVDKIPGMGLSENNFTDQLYTKLEGLEGSHWRGQFISLAALQSAIPVGSPGDYADVDGGAGEDVLRHIWDENDTKWVAQSGTAAPITAAQVKTLYESNPNTNVFTDAAEQKLEGIATGATNNAPVLIVEGANLNAYQTPGLYYSHSGALTESLTGKPAGLDTAFSLTVLPIDPTPGTTAVYQKIAAYSSVKQWGRAVSVGGATGWDAIYSAFSPPPLATTAAAGLMSAEDKVKLDAGGSGGNKGQLFATEWHNGPRSSIDAGCVPYDGQVIQFADNPVVCQAIWDGKQNAVLDANWAANKNCWSRGDGATWVRVPNLNMADGSAKPFYLRGGPESLNGTNVGDAVRDWQASFAVPITGAVPVEGAASLEGTPTTVYNSGTSYSIQRIRVQASKAVPTADENRVKTAYGVWTVRVFTEVTNTGAIDAATLATQLGVVDAELQTLKSKVGSVIVYPNGGSAASPAKVALNSRYEMDNPFPGFIVRVRAEILVSGVWAETGFIYAGTGGYGVAGGQVSASKIAVQVGSNAVCAPANHGGTPNGAITASITTATPCRAIVSKLGVF